MRRSLWVVCVSSFWTFIRNAEFEFFFRYKLNGTALPQTCAVFLPKLLRCNLHFGLWKILHSSQSFAELGTDGENNEWNCQCPNFHCFCKIVMRHIVQYLFRWISVILSSCEFRVRIASPKANMCCLGISYQSVSAFLATKSSIVSGLVKHKMRLSTEKDLEENRPLIDSI